MFSEEVRKIAGEQDQMNSLVRGMQRSAAHLEAELWKLKERLIEAERERDRALDDLEESRREANEANLKLSEGFMPRKVPEIYTEVNSLKKLLMNTSRELKDKEKEIEALRDEIEKGKEVKARLAESDTAVERLRKELENAKVAEARLKSDQEKRVRELEGDLERSKQSESMMFESLATLRKELEQTKLSLEESKLEMFMMRTKNNMDLSAAKNRSEENMLGKDNPKGLRPESLEQMLARTNDEVRKLKVELRLSNLAEENSKKALDDLVIALKEVATESNQVYLKLDVTQAELDHSRQEETNLKMRLQVAEEMSKKLVDEFRAENKRLQFTVERLRSEMEESLVSWIEKEAGFIACIHAAEDDKAIAQNETMRLGEILKATNKMVKSSREENNKLREILRQALNEASVAKDAASIAGTENSRLKDDISEKDDVLQFLTQENESLRTNEATAMENIRKLKRLANESMMTIGKEQRKPKSQHPNVKKNNEQINNHNQGKRLGKALSFNLKERRVHHNNHPKHNKENGSNDVDDDPLRGSIFDTVGLACSPPRHHQRNSSSAISSDYEMTTSEDRKHVVDRFRLDKANEADREWMSRKKVALLQRFGDLIRRKSDPDR